MRIDLYLDNRLIVTRPMPDCIYGKPCLMWKGPHLEIFLRRVRGAKIDYARLSNAAVNAAQSEGLSIHGMRYVGPSAVDRASGKKHIKESHQYMKNMFWDER